MSQKTLPYGLTVKNMDLDAMHELIVDTVQEVCEKTFREVSAVKIFRHVIEPSTRSGLDPEQELGSLIYVDDSITYSLAELYEGLLYVNVFLTMDTEGNYLLYPASRNPRFYEALKNHPMFEEVIYDDSSPLWNSIVDIVDGQIPVFKGAIICQVNAETLNDFEPVFEDEELNEYLIEEDMRNAVEYAICQTLLHEEDLNDVDEKVIYDTVEEYVDELSLPEPPPMRFTDKVKDIEPLSIDEDLLRTLIYLVKEKK